MKSFPIAALRRLPLALLLALLLTACGPSSGLAPASESEARAKTSAPRATSAPEPAAGAPEEEVPDQDSSGARRPAPDDGGRRLAFEPGADSAEVSGSVVRGEEQRYMLAAQAGQVLDVDVTALEDNAVFQIYDPAGAPLPGAAPGDAAASWSGTLPAAGDYAIVVGPTRGNASYTLQVHVSALAGAGSPIRELDWEAALADDTRLEREDFNDQLYVIVKDAAPPVGGHPLLDDIVYVDMDGDGAEEAAIPLASGGTAGNVGALIYRLAGSEPALTAWTDGYKLGLKVEDGKLVIHNAFYAGWEPNCCPSGIGYDTYVLEAGQLKRLDHRDEGFVEAQAPTVEHFYHLIDNKELTAAYALLSESEQAANPYAAWSAGYDSTLGVKATVTPDPTRPNTVRVELESTDKAPDGSQVVRRYSGTWELAWDPERAWVLTNPAIAPAP